MRRILLALALLAPLGLQAQDNPLAGTSWALVEIQSMDDNSWAPKDPAAYTLAFDADGTVSLRSDCNRANGTWESSGSQLTFGPLAATRALCGPDSLDERYRAQFESVRSFVLRDGHLFLATMADGAIIEFRPADDRPVAARVLGRDIRAERPDAVNNEVLRILFTDYASRNGLAATEEEVNAYLDVIERRAAANGSGQAPDPETAAETRRMRATFARAIIEQWKVNRALYEEYGGRLIEQQLGPEPLDAYREHLEARQAAGDFEILDEAANSSFWNYLNTVNESYVMSDEAAARAFDVPPWERD